MPPRDPGMDPQPTCGHRVAAARRERLDQEFEDAPEAPATKGTGSAGLDS